MSILCEAPAQLGIVQLYCAWAPETFREAFASPSFVVGAAVFGFASVVEPRVALHVGLGFFAVAGAEMALRWLS